MTPGGWAPHLSSGQLGGLVQHMSIDDVVRRLGEPRHRTRDKRIDQLEYGPVTHAGGWLTLWFQDGRLDLVEWHPGGPSSGELWSQAPEYVRDLLEMPSAMDELQRQVEGLTRAPEADESTALLLRAHPTPTTVVELQFVDDDLVSLQFGSR